MKKRIGIALVLAVVMVLSFGAPVLAWEVEDPCVADNEDFIAGGGVDGGAWETQSGTQPWLYGKNPNEGYSLYRDDVTNTGNLDSAFILTYTPDKVDLPIIAEYWYPDTGSYWYTGDESSDTWYWALEARGYNQPKSENHYITIRLPDASLKVKRSGTMWYGDVDFNDGTWRIQIPAGVRIWSDKGGPAHKVVVDENGEVLPGIWWSHGEITVTRM